VTIFCDGMTVTVTLEVSLPTQWKVMQTVELRNEIGSIGFAVTTVRFDVSYGLSVFSRLSIYNLRVFINKMLSTQSLIN
jgi:hypothetical protein